MSSSTLPAKRCHLIFGAKSDQPGAVDYPTIRYTLKVPAVEQWMGGVPAVLVANPSAHSGRAAVVIRRARAILDEFGVRHRFIATEPGGRTTPLVTQAIDDAGARLIVYMGGDGTFAEVAKGILQSAHAPSVALGMLPNGTANDQGKSFGLGAGPSAFDSNVAVIAAGHALAIDVGRLTIDTDQGTLHDWFFDSFSLGSGAAILRTRNRDRKRLAKMPFADRVYKGHAVYFGAFVQELAHSYLVDPKFDADVVIDGRVVPYESVLDLIIKNTPIFGGQWVLSPDAEADDGRFELICVDGRRDFARHFFAAYRHSPVNQEDLRRLGLGTAEPRVGTSYAITVRSSVLPAAQADGEELPVARRYVVQAVPRALNVLVARDPAEI